MEGWIKKELRVTGYVLKEKNWNIGIMDKKTSCELRVTPL